MLFNPNHLLRKISILSHSLLLPPNFQATHILVALSCVAFVSSSIAQTTGVGSKVKEMTQESTVVKTFAKDTKKTDIQDPLQTHISAENMHGQPDRYLQLEHKIHVTRGDMVFTSDTATYHNVEDELEAQGHVTLQRRLDCYRSDYLRFILETGAGFVLNPSYRLARNNAQGHAEKISFENEERSTITNGTYSTCEGLSPDWYLKADTLNLDTGIDTGVAGKAVLYFKGVPILRTLPFIDFSFPLSGARHSGLLPPTAGHSNKGGIEFGLPYYFNIAPNRDLTVHPRVIAKRGLQLGLEGRYMGESFFGETSIEAIRDRQTNSTRYAVNSVHTQKLLPELQLSWNINKASDNDYPTDFSNSTTKTAQRLLPRDIAFDYFGTFWNASLRSTSYQLLQDISAPITLPYERLPQLNFHAGQNDIGGFDWSIDAMLTRFWHPTMILGQRAIVYPQVSFPVIAPAFFMTPKLALHASQYQIKNQSKHSLGLFNNQDKNLQRVVPSVSIDSGLIFERQANLLGKNMTQTLEPRLFYVNTPYRDQNQFPLFDTALADFNFAQIFSENRFIGHDRIGDSNQITAGLISRFIEDNGVERFKFALGQRFYFNTQKVSLDGKINPSRSDLLLAGNGQISDTLHLEAALQVSQSDRQSVRSNYAVHWQPAPKKILNLQYQFQRDVLKQIEVSGQWPLAQRWYAVGKSNYSLLNRKLVEGLAGFEYRADCWALRFVSHRFATTNSANTSGFSIQLELTGLAKLGFGANPIETLKKNITGYQPVN